MARIDTLNNFLADISDKFREKLGITGKIIHAEYDVKIDDVYEAGKTAEYERFWDCFLAPFKDGAAFAYTFADKGWNDNTLNIPLKHLPLKPTSTNYPFRGCSATTLPSIDFTNCENLNSTYGYARNAITIGTVILRSDGTNSFTNTFTYCDELENITFDGVIGASISFGRSPKLSIESVDNITDHLKDLTGATAQTITFHPTVGNALTDTQKSNIQSKNWSAVY